MKRGRSCSIPACGRRHSGHGLCGLHLGRQKRHGDPLGGRARNGLPMAERLAAKSQTRPSGCLEWTGSVTPHGYGQLHDASVARPRLAHRIAYELAKGPIPDGLVIDHLCLNKRCVNPGHLEAVTQGDNVRRWYAARRAGVAA